MKKLIIGVLCFAALMGLSALPAFAATKTVTWSLPADWESSADFGYPSDPVGAPALKFIPVSIAVPEGSVYSNCTVEATWVATDDPRPEVINEPHIVGEAPILSPEDPQYWNAAYFPATPESVGGVQTCAGEAAIMAWVTPYRWNGRTQKLEKATALKLTFTYDAPRAKLKLKTSSANGYTGVLYIISPPNFVDLWRAYVDYRQTTHPHVEFIIVNTVTDIYPNYTGDDALKIHKYLEAKYAARNGRTMYAILGAGCAKQNEGYNQNTMIPLRMTVAKNCSYFPSDLYYACMDKVDNKGQVWDYDNDGYYLGTSKTASDPNWKVDWIPDLAVFRFPVRTSVYLQNVSSTASRTYTAKQQIDGLVAKLKRVEHNGGSPDYAGDFKGGYSGNKIIQEFSRGSTLDVVAGERWFTDNHGNFWAASHANPIIDWEVLSRNVIYDHWVGETPLRQVYSDTAGMSNDLEMNIQCSHGQEQTAAPYQAYDFFTSSRIQKVMNVANPCQTGHIDMGDKYGHGNISFAEASVLNPYGGALVSFNNTREGYAEYPGYRETLSFLMQISLTEGFFTLGDGTAADAFIKGHQRARNRAGSFGAGGVMAACYVETLALGDPLAKVATAANNVNFTGTIDGLMAKNATASGDISVTSFSAAKNLTISPNGGTATVSGQDLKVFNKLTVNNGNLVWDSAGGVGRNGIEFTNGRGNLTMNGAAVRYFGTRFTNVGNILVNGSGVTLDFDKTGSVRDITSLAFKSGNGKSNAIRSREGGIFRDTLTIPVTDNSLLVLNTINVGGVADKRSCAPLFALTNSTLRIDENPHWGTEFLSRSVTMNASTINVNYQSVGFGPAVNNAGFNLDVLGGNNFINGSQDAEISGVFKVDVAEGANLQVAVPLTKSGRTGSLVKEGEGTLELRAANTFAGGVRINEGKVVFGDEALTTSACGEVTVESGATLEIEALPLANVTKLTVRDGGKLILPGPASTAAYQLVDPMKGSLDFGPDAEVYNVNDLTKKLNGTTTSDGYYMDTSAFLKWKDNDGTWSTSSGSKWQQGENDVDFANGNSVMFPNHDGADVHNIAVSGTIQPGYITFNNTETAYNFTGSDAKIEVENLYTVGETKFAPAVSAGSKTVVTSGKTTYGNLTTASVSVSPEGKLQLTGTLTPATYISKVVVKVTGYPGESIPGLGTKYSGYHFNGIRFYIDGKPLAIPSGTKVDASGTFNGKTGSGTATVQGVDESGTIAGYSGNLAVANILDSSASTGWGSGDPGSTLVFSSGTCTITITFGSPIRMFNSYTIAGGDTASRSPRSWTVTVTENGSGSSQQVDSRSSGTSAQKWTTISGISYSGTTSGAVNVSEGGTLFLNGTYNAPITVGANAKLAVTNNLMLTANKPLTLNGNVTLDVNEAQKSTWFEVLHGANLASTAISKFTLNSDEAAAKIDGGNLYVATQGVKKGPYTRAVSGDNWNWDSSDWKGNGTDFGCTWSQAITRMADDVIITMNNSSTGTLNCAVSCNTIFFTNTTDNVQTVRVNGTGAVSCKTLDFSGLKGEITWAPSVNGANVVAGTNRVILLNGNGDTVSVASNGYVSTVGTFSTYDIQPETHMHFANSGRTLNMNQLPSQGVLSFDGMTIQSGVQGAFQKPNITYLVEDGQSLALTDGTGFTGRCLSSFDVRGGNVTINPGGAWWFGQNGVTKYNQTGGTFRCNANSSVLFGYQGEASFLFDINVAGGTFEIPSTDANIYNPANINIGTNGVFRAKGITVRDTVTGTVNINELGTLEIGSTALATARVTYNLNGGALTCYENATVGASLELGGAGTLAAKPSTTLTVNGAINAENSTLNIGKADYTGTVKFTMPTSPAGVTNLNVVAGTLDLGAVRMPTAAVSQMGGNIRISLSQEELVEAAADGLVIFKTSLAASAFTGKITVVTPGATEIPGLCSVSDGKLVLRVGYVYPLKAETKADTAWEDLDWVDSIGMGFIGLWENVPSAELTNTLTGVTLTAPEDFPSSLKIVNTGDITINGENTLATLDDSLSTGKTTVGFTANTVTAGLRTELGKSGTTLNVVSGHYACLANGVTFTTQNVVAGAHVRYDSAAQRTTLGGTVAGAIYSYGNAKFTTNISDYNWILRTEASDAVILGITQYHMPLDVSGGTLTVGTGGGEYVYGGNNNTGTNSVITVNSGTFKVDLPTSSVNGSNGYRGFIVGGTATVSKHPYVIVNGGTFDSSTSIFAPWEYCTVNLNGGTLKAKGICRGGRTEANLNLNGGVLEIGAGGITKHSSSTGTFNIRLQGSTIRATDNVTLSLAMTASGTSYLQAASGKKLTMGVVPSGTGTLICGDTTNNGTVELTGGSYENLTLGGTFTIRLTTTQQATTLDVALFKAAADLDPANVTVVKSDGTEIAGVKVIKDGKLCWAPASGYMLPVVATVSGTQGWLDLAWKDSSPTPRDVPAEFWTSFTTASVKLIAEGEAKITAPSSAITVATTEVTGEGRLFLPNSANLTLGTVTGDGTIVCDNFCKVYTGLNQSAWTGTYVLTNQSAASGASAGTKLGYTFAGLGNTGSVVEVSDVAGWFDGCSACTETPFKGTEHHYTLKIGSGGLNLNDGSSSQGYCFDKLVGAGNLNVGKASGGPSSRVIVLDATEYTGALSVVGNSGVIIGTPSAVTENGTIAIDGTYVSQGTAKLSAASGVTVRAGGIVNLVGEATQKNWPINASGSLTANGSVKLNGNRVLTRNWKTEGGSIVLKEDAEDYPAILDNAYLWLDATEDASITTNASGEVQSWKSVVGDKSAAKYPATGVTAGPTVAENALVGNRVVDFGALGSGKDLSFTRATTIKAVFMVVDIVQAQGAFLLGDGTTFHFHRGSGGNYFSGNPPAEIKTNGKTYRNGVRVADPVNTKIPTGYGLIEVIPQDNSTQICAERICADRNCADSGVYRNGGKKLGELIILTTAPTEAERLAIESYLMGRWGFGYVGTVTSTPAEFTTGEGVDVIGAYHLGSDFTVKNPTIENATFNIGADIYVGAFTVNAAQPLTIAAEGGSVSATSIDDSTSTAKTVLDFATGASTITAGADTVLTTTGTGTITVGANKKVTLYGDAALSRAASSITFSEGTSTYRTGALKFGADGGQGLTALPSAYANLFKTTGKFIIDRALTIDGELVFGNANNVRQYSTFEVGSNAHITATYLHTASGQNYFQGNQNGGVVEITSTGEGDAEGANAVRFGHWNGSSTYNLNHGEMLVAGGIMLGWDSTDGDGTVLNIGAANETKPALVRAASIRGCTSGNANKKAMLKIYPNGVLEVKNGVLMAHQNSTQKQFVMAGGTLRATGDATVALVHADGLKLTAASTLSAKTGNTLTVAAKVTGASPLTIGEADQAGTVKLSGDIAGFTGDVTVTAGTLEVPAGVLKGNVTIAADGILNLSGSTGESTYVVAAGQVTLGTGATVGNIRLNGVPFEGNWELKDGKLIEHYEVISVNIGGGQNGSGASPSDYLVTGDAAVGLEAVPGKHWNNVNGRWGSASTVSIVASKAYNRTEEVTRNSVQVTASANNTYGWGSAATAFFKGYLDDGGAHAHITVSGIPYERYDVIVYGTADSASMKLAAITVNDTAYTWDSSAQKTVPGSASWGATQASTPTLGGNALLIKGLTSRDLTIVGGANASGARGGLAAFQIINRAVRITESTGYTATVSDSRDFTAYDWTPSPFVSGPFSYADITVGTYEPVTATIAEDLTLQKLGVTSTANQSLTLAKSAGTVAIGLYDFSAASGKTIVGFDIGSTPFTVGGGRLVFGGTMNNFDWSVYTGKTIELAGGYSIKADARLGASMMILSGTGSTRNNENGLKDGAHLVIPSGTFTLSQRFVVGQGANNQTMHLDITGGTLASGNDGFMYTGGYSGNTLHTTLSAGSWTANYIVWNDNGATANTFNIHTFGSGLFAPAFIGTIDGSGNKVANDRDVSAGYRHHVYLGEGGTFSLPAIVPNWLEVVVTNGTGTITAQTAESVIRSRVTVNAGTMLDFNLGADNTVEFANLTKTNAELVNNGTVKISSGTFKLAKGVTLTGDIVFVKGAAIDIATDTPEAEEFTVTTGNLTFNGTLKVNGTIKEGVWTGKGGKIVRGELKDFHVTLPEGTASTNFSAIVWDEGAYSSGTNHTVTINAPNGCEIVIDQSITNQSFTVNCTGTCSVKVVDEAIVALSDGFLGNIASIAYGENTTASTFSLNGSTGWTCANDVSFDYAILDPHGYDIAYTGTIEEIPGRGTASAVTICDLGEKMDGCVTFDDNASGLGDIIVTRGAVKFQTLEQITLGCLTGYANGRIIIAAKDDESAIIVDSEASLTGMTIDIDTFTAEPIPEDIVEYKLITAPAIYIDDVKLGDSFKGNWELVVKGEEYVSQTLVARKTKKGFYFIIADIPELETTIAYHDAESKDALDIDRDWVAEKAGLTEAQKEDDGTVALAINTEGDNGARLYESYVLGLEPTDATSKPVIAPVQSAAADKIAFRLDNIAVNPRAGANNVKYKVWSGANPGDKTTASQVASYTDPIAVDLPTSGVRYYHIEVLID